MGFSNGDMAVGAKIEIFDKNNQKLSEIISDEDGFFKLPLKGDGPFTFQANLGAGHIAEVVLERDVAISAQRQQGEVNTIQAVIGGAELEKIINRSVASQIKPLTKELAAYKEQNDLQKILGGLGYILGIAGIGFYFAARHKLQGQSK
ncbi:MAG: cobalt ABC transporter permease [Rhodospirillales bacterium]|nr:cobalt ABC transporter permease [Rhodospirillales bacterium]